MTQLDRRRVLRSLTGGAVLASMAQAISAPALAAPDGLRERAERYFYWFLARQNGAPGPGSFDFWCMPYAVARYENYLPPQVTRTLLAYENFARPLDTTDKAQEAFVKASKFYYRDWLELEKLDSLMVEPVIGSTTFKSILSSLASEGEVANRTALLSIDDNNWWPGWEQIFPAFASHYKSVVGLRHVRERGFIQQDRFYKRHSDFGFIPGWLRSTLSCDAVIVTSPGLIETDAGLCPGATTEDLVGELVRRLSYALTEPKILQRIVGFGGKSKTRYFALGSATLNVRYESLLHFQAMLERQSTFVSASFAPLVVADLPLFIITSKDDDPMLRIPVGDVLAWAASISGYEIGPEMFATVQAPRYQPETRRPVGLDLIALWPFKLVED